MTDTTNPPNDFNSSAKRFAQAVAAIDKLRGQVATLYDLRKQQGRATAALEGSGVALHAAVEALAPIGELGAELLASLKSAVSSAEMAFDEGTIKAIRDDIAALGEEVGVLRDGIQAERDEARRELSDMQTRIQTLPRRVRAKYGLA